MGGGVVLSDVILLGLGWTKNWLLEGDAASVESYLKRPFPPDEVLPAQVPVQLPMYPAQVPALRVAAAKGHVEVVQLLLLASADADKADQNEGLIRGLFQLVCLFSNDPDEIDAIFPMDLYQRNHSKTDPTVLDG